jgi:hypothetical protein
MVVYKSLFICLGAVICCNQHSPKENLNAVLLIQDSIRKDVSNINTSNAEEKKKAELSSPVDPNFEKFYLKFHTDSSYQLNRIKFPLPGFNTDEEEGRLSDKDGVKKYFWTKDKWVLMNIPDLNNGYSINKIKTDSTYEEKISLPNTGYYIIRNFKKENGGWYLVYYGVHNL